jgi:hypothetical protein
MLNHELIMVTPLHFVREYYEESVMMKGFDRILPRPIALLLPKPRFARCT